MHAYCIIMKKVICTYKWESNSKPRNRDSRDRCIRVLQSNKHDETHLFS